MLYHAFIKFLKNDDYKIFKEWFCKFTFYMHFLEYFSKTDIMKYLETAKYPTKVIEYIEKCIVISIYV